MAAAYDRDMGTWPVGPRRWTLTGRVVLRWILAPALVLGVVAMHATITTPSLVGRDAVAMQVVDAHPVHPTVTDAAPAGEPAPAGPDCGALVMVCLGIVLALAVGLIAGPARAWLDRCRPLAPLHAARQRPPFAPMSVLLTTSILRC